MFLLIIIIWNHLNLHACQQWYVIIVTQGRDLFSAYKSQRANVRVIFHEMCCHRGVWPYFIFSSNAEYTNPQHSQTAVKVFCHPLHEQFVCLYPLSFTCPSTLSLSFSLSSQTLAGFSLFASFIKIHLGYHYSKHFQLRLRSLRFEQLVPL